MTRLMEQPKVLYKLSITSFFFFYYICVCVLEDLIIKQKYDIMLDDENYCIVYGCQNNRRRCSHSQFIESEQAVHYYKFPLDDFALLNKWLEALRRNNSFELAVGEKSRICNMHFTTEDFTTATTMVSERQSSSNETKKLKLNAVPSIFLNSGVEQNCEQLTITGDVEYDDDEDIIIPLTFSSHNNENKLNGENTSIDNNNSALIGAATALAATSYSITSLYSPSDTKVICFQFLLFIILY